MGPDLLLRYVNMFQDEPQVVAVMQAWVGAVTEDVRTGLKGDKSAVLKLRTGQAEVSKKNKRHLDVLVSAGANVDAWIQATELEHDPETLFHLGEAVASCQAITGSISKNYAQSLTSLFAVGHIGALVAADGNACEPLARGARTCENLQMRAVIRFLIAHREEEKDAPVLVLERPYTGVTVKEAMSPRAKKYALELLSKAFALCDKVGAHFLVLDTYEWTDYLQGTQLAPDEFTNWKLESVDGFSPYTYSDALSPSEATLSKNYTMSNVY